MKKVFFLILIMTNLYFGAAQDTSQPPRVTPTQLTRVEEQIDKNTKTTTLLMTAISALTVFIGALLIYIKKQHSQIIVLTKRSIESTEQYTASQDKLATTIENSFEKLSHSIDSQERTSNKLHEFIVNNMLGRR